MLLNDVLKFVNSTGLHASLVLMFWLWIFDMCFPKINRIFLELYFIYIYVSMLESYWLEICILNTMW